MTDGRPAEDLHTLETEELRQRAFAKAESARDLHFFWDLVKHLRASRALAAEDASSGALTGSISEVITLVRELLGKDLGEDEPLVRARFIDYLQH